MAIEYGKSTGYNTDTSGADYKPGSQTDKLRQEGLAAADQAKQSSKETIDKVSEQVRQTVNQVKQQGETRFEEEKQRTADEVGEVAKTLHHTAEQLGSQEHGNIANYVDVAAEQLDRVSSAIRDQDLYGIVRQVENFARQQPAVFLGAAVAAGFFAGRFLKSSAERNRHVYDDDYIYDDSYDDNVAYDDSYSADEDDRAAGKYAYDPENDDDDRLEHTSKYGYPLAPGEVITDDEPYDPAVTPSKTNQVSGFSEKPAATSATPATPSISADKAPPRTPINDISSLDSSLSSDPSKNKTYL